MSWPVRFLLVIFATWFAIAGAPEPQAPQPVRVETRDHDGGYEETVWMSKTCTNSRWYLKESDDQKIVAECWPQPDPDDGNR